MKSFKELEEIAKTGAPLPEKLSFVEQQCYLALRSLYQEFRGGVISAEIAVRDKRAIKGEYEQAQKTWEFWGDMMGKDAANRVLTSGKRSELRKCKPEDRLRVALELIELYSGEDWSELKLEEEKS